METKLTKTEAEILDAMKNDGLVIVSSAGRLWARNANGIAPVTIRHSSYIKFCTNGLIEEIEPTNNQSTMAHYYRLTSR